MAKTIVLIESGEMADTLERRLAGAGHLVRTATDLQKATKLLWNEKFDAIVANPDVLGMDCETFRSKIRLRFGADLPIVLIATWSSLATCRGCKDVFCTALRCVDAPADPDEVLNKLRSLLDKVPYEAPVTMGNGGRVKLSRREREVLSLLRRGCTNREIAQKLYIVEKVVEKHIANICGKLGVRNRTEAVALSYRRHIQ
ncbi:MAG: response regulator transcription factor [Abditibacteriales bacterium]|nr:response regulator transcription factor [Abditibacteriales bacterium]MDW8365744.1 response regulator transcription factor [Abditibacteriales bacterium]